MGFGMCDVCGGRLIMVESRDVGGTEYVLLRCEKCNRIIARSKFK